MTTQDGAQKPSPEGGLINIRLIAQKSSCQQARRPLLRGTNHKVKKVLLFRPNCKQWDCPHCADLKAGKWRYVATYGVDQLMASGLPIDFVTITSHEKLSPAAAIKVLAKAWPKLNERIRKTGQIKQYFCITERQRNGKVHLHMIVTARLSKKWWKDNARECGFGYQSDVRQVQKVGGVTKYVTKYLTKAATETAWPARFRRVRTSRGWPDLPDLPPSEDWQFVKLPSATQMDVEVSRALLIGYEVIIADGSSAWGVVNGES